VQRGQRTWMRGAVTLAALAALTIGVLAAPGGAAGTLTKAKVKKIAKKVANKVVDAENAIVASDFPDADPGPGTTGFTYGPTTTIASLTVPAGNWAYHTDFLISRNSGGLVVGCRLLSGATIVDQTNSFEGDTQSVETVSMQGASAFPNGGTIEVRCDDGVAGGSGNSAERGIDIIAIEGSTLA
jgi:hypothetical protein